MKHLKNLLIISLLFQAEIILSQSQSQIQNSKESADDLMRQHKINYAIEKVKEAGWKLETITPFYNDLYHFEGMPLDCLKTKDRVITGPITMMVFVKGTDKNLTLSKLIEIEMDTIVKTKIDTAYKNIYVDRFGHLVKVIDIYYPNHEFSSKSGKKIDQLTYFKRNNVARIIFVKIALQDEDIQTEINDNVSFDFLALANNSDIVLTDLMHRHIESKEIMHKEGCKISADEMSENCINNDFIKPYMESCFATERLFGLKNGSLVKELYFGRKNNSCFWTRFPNKIFFQTYDDCQLYYPETNAQHETIHLLDNYFKLSVDQEWKSLFYHLRPAKNKIFLDEDITIVDPDYEASEFYKTLDLMSYGSHSGDDVKEFLSSFVCSLFHEDWQSKMLSNSILFFYDYEKTLTVLLKIVQSRPMLTNTKINDLLKSKMAWFEAQEKINK